MNLRDQCSFLGQRLAEQSAYADRAFGTNFTIV